MYNLTNDQFTNVCRVLNEISLGNLNYRLKFSDENDTYDTLAMYLNLIGEIRNLYPEEPEGRHTAFSPRVPLDFMLSETFKIKRADGDVPKILDTEAEALKGRNFKDLLEKASLEDWQSLKRRFFLWDNARFSAYMTLKVNQCLGYRCCCYFSQVNSQTIRVSTYPHSKEDTIDSLMDKFDIQPPRIDDRKKNFRNNLHKTERMQEVASYISQHLDGSLPDIKNIAHRFGMNRKQLQRDFKAIFKQSPYAYCIDKKLKRAKQLLKTTRMSIEEVASSIGYNAKSSFYEAFKKKFGITPGDVVREG